MSIVRPFKGIRFDPGEAEAALSDLVAPPYDVISVDERSALAQRSRHNVIRLILPEPEKGETEKHNRYARAARLWRDWRSSGVLKEDPEPAFYRYMMNFQVKTPEGIVKRSRPGFVALLELHEYSEGRVLPHERTLAGPKQDRFQLMLHTRANLSQVFMLYPDKQGEVEKALGSGPCSEKEVQRCEDEQGVEHVMWPVRDRSAVRAVESFLDSTHLYIADGHHRYETALTLRKHLQKTSPLFAQGSDFVMAYFTPAEHQGLVVFPYHRLVHNLPKRRLSGFLKKLGNFFQVEPALASPLNQGSTRREFMKSLEERGREGTVFGLVDGVSGNAYFLTLKQGSALYRSCETEKDMVLCGLDVVILEDLVLIGMLGMKPKELLNEKFVAYETDYDRILDAVQKPPHQLAFMLNPSPVSDVIRVADLGGIMPEKSTYFFPKLATGLVMYSMED